MQRTTRNQLLQQSVDAIRCATKQNKTLRGIFCSSNQLSALYLAKNTALEHLCCDNNQFAELDICQQKELYAFDCSNNPLLAQLKTGAMPDLCKVKIGQNHRLPPEQCHQMKELAALNRNNVQRPLFKPTIGGYRFIDQLITIETLMPGFCLSRDFSGHDQDLANFANAYIGLDAPESNSPTAVYLRDAIAADIPVNEEIPEHKQSVAFVSVAAGSIYMEKTIELAKCVLSGYGTVIMSPAAPAEICNILDAEIAEDSTIKKGQTKKGYPIWGNLRNITEYL
jgi:hypothetical protein